MDEARNATSRFSRLSGLLELAVVDVDGDVVGRIEDLLVDVRDGSIQYVRVVLEEPQGSAKAGAGPPRVSRRRVLTVPWSAVRIEPELAVARWRIAARRATLERIARAETRTGSA